jgi:undecaprenyl-diphosphatase
MQQNAVRRLLYHAGVRMLRHMGGYSFPSGHVVTYVAFFGFAAHLAGIDVHSPTLSWLIILPCAGMIALVGPSRIYLGAHWASDVLGAYLLGGLWLGLVTRA